MINKNTIGLSCFLLLFEVCNLSCNRKTDSYKKISSNIDSLRVIEDSTFKPYCFLEKNKSGKYEPTGLWVDIWKLWSERTGIPISYKFASMDKAINAVQKGQFDIVESICPRYREEKYKLFYSRPYYIDKVHPIIKKEKEVFFKSLSDGEFTFGTCKGDVINLILQHDYKNITAVPIDGYGNMIKSLINGDVNGVIMEEPVFRYTLFTRDEQKKLDDFVILPDAIDEEICSASSNPKIIQIVNSGFDRISHSEIQSIEKKWIHKYDSNVLVDSIEAFINWVKENKLIGSIIILVIAVVLLNIVLVILYFTSSNTLIKVSSSIAKSSLLNIKIRSLTIPIKNLLITDFLVCNSRSIKNFYKENRKGWLDKILINFNVNKTELDYLPLPIKIQNERIGNMPLIDNIEVIKSELKNIIVSPKFKIVIVGNGGIGKTTFCIQLIKWAFEDIKFNPAPILFLPVSFESIDENKKQDDFYNDSISLIKNLANSYYNKCLTDELFEYLVDKKLLILIIDGISEYSSEKRLKIYQFLSFWKKESLSCIITTRSFEKKSLLSDSVFVEPDVLQTAFLMTLIQKTILTFKMADFLEEEDNKKVSYIYTHLNRLTNEEGITPLFAILFSRELYYATSKGIDLLDQNSGFLIQLENVISHYLYRIIEKNEDIKEDSVSNTSDKLMNFASYFSWRQITLNNTYSLNNNVKFEDIQNFENAEYFLNLLKKPGSILIRNGDSYKIKFDPIAEALACIYIYNQLYLFKENNEIVVFNNLLNMQKDEIEIREIDSFLKLLLQYAEEKSIYLKNDDRSNNALNKIKKYIK